MSSLDLSNSNTEKVTEMSYMFQDCSGLKTIYVGDSFTTEAFANDIFNNCKNLVGHEKYEENKTGVEYANYKTGYFIKKVGMLGTDVLGATGEDLTLTKELTLSDDADLVLTESVKAKNVSSSRTVTSTWGTLCVPFALTQSEGNNCTYYRLTGIDNDKDCITLDSYEEGEIAAGTPVLFKMKEGMTALTFSASDASIAAKPVVTDHSDVYLIGAFTKIGGKGNEGLAATDYIIGKDKFWLVSELTANAESKDVVVKPMRVYIHPTTIANAKASVLSIGNGEGTTAIDDLNAISNDTDAAYYDMQGRRISGLQKGLNIVKSGDKTYKIMIK